MPKKHPRPYSYRRCCDNTGNSEQGKKARKQVDQQTVTISTTFSKEDFDKPPQGGFFLPGAWPGTHRKKERAQKSPDWLGFQEFLPPCGNSRQLDYLAEEAGFEPAVGLTLRTLSRRVT